MNFALIYLAHRFLFRLADFFHHWYVDALRHLIHWFVSLLERLDRFFAVRITFRYLFEPLWKDYTVIGRAMGFFFRSGRILIGSLVYAFLGIVFVLACLIWILAPFVALVAAYRGRSFGLL